MSIIGYCCYDLHLPCCRSLKEKRMIISSIKQKLRRDFNISISELDYNDYWQRTLIGIVTICNNQGTVVSIFDKISSILDNNPEIEIIEEKRYYY